MRWRSCVHLFPVGVRPMPRRLRLATLYLVFLPCSILAARATEEDEPTVRGMKAGEWLEMLRKDPKPDRRQAALLALGILGPKIPGVVLGVSDALKDADVEVRRNAAQT